MSFDIEAIVSGVADTIRDAIPDFRYVGEPAETIPPDGPFCLVEHIGGPIALGNLEDWTHEFRITAGVKRVGMIVQERKVARAYALDIIRALTANIHIDEAFLADAAELGTSAEMAYASEPFVGCSVTVRYQTTEGVAHLISD